MHDAPAEKETGGQTLEENQLPLPKPTALIPQLRQPNPWAAASQSPALGFTAEQMRSYAALAVQQEKVRLFHLVMDACAAQMNMGERNGEEWDKGVWACSVAIDAIRNGEKNA